MFDGKVALVTGAGSGIGRASALAFAEAGAAVAVCDIEREAAEETVAAIADRGRRAAALVADVTQPGEVQELIAETERAFGRVDFAHNNAGIAGPSAKVARYPEEDFVRVLTLDLAAVFYCMKYEIQAMLRTGGGAIVNTASFAGIVGVPRLAGYVAAKHGVVGLTKTAALEYAAEGIRVNCVCPGSTRTAMTEEYIRRQPGLEGALAGVTPLRRLAEVDEIARAVIWLCSDAASFVIGHALPVDGGATVQ
jgi:NAD(P)-dependent dehydrogenase (short-subunit alcohol dehydrogenase family)